MVEDKTELSEILRFEMVDKGAAPAIATALGALIILFYRFNTTLHGQTIQIIAGIIIFLCLIRLQIIQRTKKYNLLTGSNGLLFRSNILLTSLFFSGLLTMASIELKFQGVHFTVITAVLCGFVSTSLITLATDIALFALVQLIMLLPPTLVVMYDSFGANEYQMGTLIPFYIIFLIYQLHQVRDFRRKVISNFKSQIDLKKTNQVLHDAQEALIQQTVKLVHTSRLAALGEMAAGIAHEVNNPLAIISGSLEQLERNISHKEFEKPDVLLKHTDRSRNSIKRITNIISGLRQFSQQSDSQPKTKVTLSHIVEDTLNFCGEMLKARYVKLKIGEIPDVVIECHPVQISQVLINLIKNAEDALLETKDENERWVELVFEKSNPCVHIHVSNGGPRIPEAFQSKLFEPFYTTKVVGKGTGLGLSISRGIMKEHGGDLVFNQSKPQTTFSISLPFLH